MSIKLSDEFMQHFAQLFGVTPRVIQTRYKTGTCLKCGSDATKRENAVNRNCMIGYLCDECYKD